MLFMIPLLVFSVTAENINECKVHEPGDYWDGHDCRFPFVWDEEIYYECTNVAPLKDWPCRVWCATKVKNSTNELLTDYSWGYCSEGCPLKCKLEDLLLN